ncbi:MAG: metal-dependent transcriptional regulator [Deltaproteobacteria bacterium]|nr:metal-dependent transcriptional regulator [Deltaproteobacteria bacterium]
MNISSTMEDYLETIFELESDNEYVRVKDIAHKMNVKLPTVTSMLNSLQKRSLVSHEKYDHVELTRKGRKIAKEVYRSHTMIKKFLMDVLNIDAKTADEDACKMEHAVSSETLERIVTFMEFIEECPRGGSDWLKNFDRYHKHGRSDEKCLERMKDFEKQYSAEIKKIENKLT